MISNTKKQEQGSDLYLWAVLWNCITVGSCHQTCSILNQLVYCYSQSVNQYQSVYIFIPCKVPPLLVCWCIWLKVLRQPVFVLFLFFRSNKKWWLLFPTRSASSNRISSRNESFPPTLKAKYVSYIALLRFFWLTLCSFSRKYWGIGFF